MILAALAAAASLMLSAGYRLYDTDLWTLLVTGKAIWGGHGLPMRDQWTWTNFGAPEVMSSWLFRALLWPVWSAGGILALFAWRWSLQLATYALLWATARRLGARGPGALVALAWCGVVARLRTDVRPEALAALLFAAAFWILETRRTAPPTGAPGPDRRAWLIPIACIWANAHLSWYLLFFLWGLYLLDGRGGRPWKLVLLAGLAMLVNPWGLAMLRQPFEFVFVWSREPIFHFIAELQPLDLSSHQRDGLLLLAGLWGVLALWRWWGHTPQAGPRFDWVEIPGGALLLAASFRSQRFLGIFAIFVAPFLARDLAQLVQAIPRGLLPRPPRALPPLAAALACLTIGIPEWSNPDLPLGVSLDQDALPVAACDFVQSHGIRGRAFNDFHLGGYVAWRFWPDRSRLPFMTTQPENARREDRDAIVSVGLDAPAWTALDRRCRFDWLLLDRERNGPADRLLSTLDRDSSFACVFMDDDAYLFVRREGATAALADSFGFRQVPADPAGREALIARCENDVAIRSAARTEFARQAQDSPRNAFAEQALGTLELMDGRYGEARIHLERAIEVRPSLESARRMLAAAPAGR